MLKKLFVLSEDDVRDLKELAGRHNKTQSALVREGIGLLKVRYRPTPHVYTEKKTEYIPNFCGKEQRTGTNLLPDGA